VGAVEREQAGLERRQGDAVLPAHQSLAHHDLGRAVHRIDQQRAVAQLERELDGVRDAALRACTDHDAVDHHVEVVLLDAGPIGRVGQVDGLAIDACSHEAFSAQVVDALVQVARQPSADGREQRQARAVFTREDAVDDLLNRVGAQHLAGFRAVRDADAREQQAKVVGDLGDGADGGARALAERLLFDGDGRAQPLDALDVGLRELVEKLSGIRRQRLHVATLTLRVDRVEGERRFARTAGAGDDDETISRQLEMQILQVVLLRASDDQVLHANPSS
jgi:hypothetical protein